MTPELPFHVKDFIGHGHQGSVFLVEYEGRDVAFKIRHYPNNPNPDLPSHRESCRDEYMFYERLSGVRGIPTLILILDELAGMFDDLGLDVSGARWQDVVPRYDPYIGCGYFTEPFFSGGFLFDFVPGSRDIRSISPGELNVEFFDRLEHLVAQVHERQVGVPFDAAYLESRGQPYIVDLAQAIDLSSSYVAGAPHIRRNIIENNLATARRMRTYHLSRI